MVADVALGVGDMCQAGVYPVLRSTLSAGNLGQLRRPHRRALGEPLHHGPLVQPIPAGYGSTLT